MKPRYSRIRWTQLIIVLLGCLLCVACKDHQEVRLVQVAQAKGQVSIQRNQDKKEFLAVQGMNLGLLDSIQTLEESYATLNIDNDKTIELWEQVRIQIVEMLGIAEQETSTQLSLTEGKIYIRIKRALQPDEKFEITTPNCIMGVRGTQYYVAALNGQTDLVVLSGQVEIRLFSDLGQSLIINANEQIHIDKTIETIEDVEINSVNQQSLDLMVLKAIQREPEGIAPELLNNIQDRIDEIEQPTTETMRDVIEETPQVEDGINANKVVNRSNFDKINMLDQLAAVERYLGAATEDQKFASRGNKGFVWTEGNGLIAVSVNQEGQIVDKLETGLETGSSAVDLADRQLREQIKQGMTLEAIDKVTGLPHYEFRRVLMADGSEVISYGWYSMYGGNYASITITSAGEVWSAPYFYPNK